jgi:hypothetical protein
MMGKMRKFPGGLFDWKGDIFGEEIVYKRHGHTPTLILKGSEPDKWGLYLGSRYDVSKTAAQFDIILNLSGMPLFTYHYGHTIPPKFNGLHKYAHTKDTMNQGWERELCLDWPNGGVPELEFQFWPDLLEHIKKVPRTLLFCLGGHGRTGTAACLLLITANVFSNGDDAIRWLRTNYCKEVVEGKYQVQMIDEYAKWLRKGRQQ